MFSYDDHWLTHSSRFNVSADLHWGTGYQSHKFVLGGSIEATALDELEHLIKATYTRERKDLLGRANLGLEKLRFLFRLAFDLQSIDIRRYEFACRALEEAGRLVGGWLKADA